jgi:glyoxylase-like metal-dependent hydrolase (beta-lactamase superfamily II)
VGAVVHDGGRIGPLRVVFAPAHSPGHLAFHRLEKGTLFAGDAIATWPTGASAQACGSSSIGILSPAGR